MPATEFFTGVFKTALGPGRGARRGPGAEARQRRPAGPTSRSNRRAQDWATVGVAALVHRDNGGVAGASIGLVNMGGTPLRAKASEDALASGRRSADAAALVAEGAEPPSDHAGSSEYRAHLAQVIARRALEQALAS